MTNHEFLDFNINRMQDDIKKMDTKLDVLQSTMTSFILEVKTGYLEKKDADKKFASKITERITFGLISIMLVSVLGAILKLVIT